MTNWPRFFPPGTPVTALPSWQHPRLLIPAPSMSACWTRSAYYPAFRWQARLLRLLLRIRAAATAAYEARTAAPGCWELGSFLEDALPQAASASVLIGTPGPAQKMTVEVRDGADRVIGFLKYAEKEAGRRRLRREFDVLSHLPAGLHPTPLKYGSWGDGEALLMSPLRGRPVPTTLPPSSALLAFCSRLQTAAPVPLDRHPWVRAAREQEDLQRWLEPLRGRSWPVVIQHGDFAAWNLLQHEDGKIGAYDWEYAQMEGFPHLDLAYYLLQMSALIYRRGPAESSRYAAAYLLRAPALSLSAEEARAIVRLTARDTYHKFIADGHAPDEHALRWWHSVWKNPV